MVGGSTEPVGEAVRFSEKATVFVAFCWGVKSIYYLGSLDFHLEDMFSSMNIINIELKRKLL